MKQVIKDFYKHFNNLDGKSMVALYHDEISFEDPAFGPLEGEHAKNMWLMLCKNAKDFKVQVSDIEVDGNLGSATWVADYTFSKTGRRIHNVVKAKFEFEEGKIIHHVDDFNLYKWAQQAMGLKGILFGWSTFFQNKLWSQTHALLYRFEQDL